MEKRAHVRTHTGRTHTHTCKCIYSDRTHTYTSKEKHTYTKHIVCVLFVMTSGFSTEKSAQKNGRKMAGTRYVVRYGIRMNVAAETK